jgi:hypothetical protein
MGDGNDHSDGEVTVTLTATGMVGRKIVEAEAKAKAKVGPEAKAEAHGRW